MRRITTPTRAIGLFGPGKDGYKDGDLANGIAPTDLNADAFNQLQEEIANLIESASIVLDGDVRTQLLQATRRMYGGNFRTVAAGVTALNFDNAGMVLVDASGGNVTMNLPLAAGVAGLPITLRRVDTSANLVTVNCTGADVLDIGLATSFTMAPGEVVKLRSNGVSAWLMDMVQRARFARITASGNFIVPWYVNTIYASGCAAGCGGGGGGGATNALGTGAGGAGGGAGQAIIRVPFAVVPLSVIPITIPPGGLGGGVGTPTSAGGVGAAGGNTVIGALVTLNGAAASTGGAHFTGSVPAGGSSGAAFPAGSSGNDGIVGLNGGVGNGGAGASGPYGGGGGGGRAGSTGVAGTAAAGFGAGGGGGGGGYGSGGGGANGGPGGAGAPGLAIIEW